MRVAIGADHAGFPLKEDLIAFLAAGGHDVLDVGTDSEAPVDYPKFCAAAARAVVAGDADRAIVLGGSGQGEQIAANKVLGIRAALCHDLYLARLSREHNDANVLAMGARVIAPAYARRDRVRLACDAVRGGRHVPRIEQIAAIEREERERCVSTRPIGGPCRPPTPRWRRRSQVSWTESGRPCGLIASENYASPAVLAAVGSTMNNKYAEGYPGRRYYGGCEYVDIVEQLAIDRAKQLFGAEHANVQPHAGARRTWRCSARSSSRRIGRQGARHGAGPRRPPDPRLAGERVRHVVQLWATRSTARPSSSTWTGSATWPRPAAEDHPGRLHRVPTRDRLRGVPRDRRRGRRAAVGRRLALHRAGRRRRVPVAGPVRRRRHLHDAQGAAGPARRDDPVQGRACEGDRQGRVPDDAGRPDREQHRRRRPSP